MSLAAQRGHLQGQNLANHFRAEHRLLHIHRTWLLVVGLSGLFACAAAPEGPSDEPREEQNGAKEEDAGAPPSSDDDADDDERLDASSPAPTVDAAPRDAAEAPRDASAPRLEDASADARAVPPNGEARRDAAAATPNDAAAAQNDAAARDAGSEPRRDAATTMPPGEGRCQRSSDCDQFCAFVGIFPCCGQDRMCGCTWAPGAYCL